MYYVVIHDDYEHIICLFETLEEAKLEYDYWKKIMVNMEVKLLKGAINDGLQEVVN